MLREKWGSKMWKIEKLAGDRWEEDADQNGERCRDVNRNLIVCLLVHLLDVLRVLSV